MQSDQIRLSIDPDNLEEKRLGNFSEEAAYKAELTKCRLSIGVGLVMIGRGCGRFDDLSNEFWRKTVEHGESDGRIGKGTGF